MSKRRQGVFWLLTIPQHCFTPYLPPGCAYVKGQLERGSGGFVHWQLLVGMGKKCSLGQVKEIFGPECHGELSRSAAANEYVWKEETRVEGTQFEFGALSFRRNEKRDWENIWDRATVGDLASIPPDVRVVSYRTLRAIASDHSVAFGMERTVRVYWGRTGTGKSRRAWDEAGEEAYCKDPRSKFWDGYQSQENVVIDEFRGGIDVSHLLRWFDRYPVRVEIKGSSRPFLAKNFWITSNIEPSRWYPDLDPETISALMRRLNIVEFP
ncbi:MAG: replication associated protein [Arizlama virus AZLM_25953]|nr:MAG: replication associated protein [Arizlama virus]